MFYIFIKACKKYRFGFVLHTHGKDALTIRPDNSFEYIDIKQGYYERNYSKLFLKAIKTMRKYRKEHAE